MIILGIDPGLTCTGWGVVAKAGSRLSHVANGQIRTDAKATMAQRLVELDAHTGRPIESFGDHGMVDLKVGVLKGAGEQIDLESGEIGLHTTPTVVNRSKACPALPRARTFRSKTAALSSCDG